MIVVLVAMLGLVAALALVFWPWPAGRRVTGERRETRAEPGRREDRETREDRERREKRDRRASRARRVSRGRVAPPPLRLPDSLEGVLTVQLMTGEIDSQQYIRALERIAARDERRHPMSVPPDCRP
ncbi:hypothetical protein ACWT_2609 [Actinoplanes sp. SE50]|nr:MULTISPECIES: hypothetical protein [unclassified Actinoplanes]AEV83832.1 hypothetical protein ACPL_2937 [Actinoplanes sp. SE50/110]ATO82024.1 hypothetical protein ACWT_2609 [Actinoplanes sp. SE50]SLL99432.1 hypothetical protein ACSP50_2663 [Actinoplanes sp. SE50/110]